MSEDAEQADSREVSHSLNYTHTTMLCIHLVTFPIHVERPSSVISVSHRPPALLLHSMAWAW